MRSTSSSERGQAVVLIIILLAVLGGGYWLLHTNKKKNEAGARTFAAQTARRLALHHDRKFLDQHLAYKVQATYPPSWRERFFERLRGLGQASENVEVTGDVTFTNYFFEPIGKFRVQLNYPGTPAYLDMVITHPKAVWEIEHLNLTWYGER